jgi:hypothetical protein
MGEFDTRQATGEQGGEQSEIAFVDYGCNMSCAAAPDIRETGEFMQDLDPKNGRSAEVVEQEGPQAPHDGDFAETLRIADDVMDEYNDTLADLAK